MNDILKKIKKLNAAHLKRVKPLMDKDEPVVPRGPTKEDDPAIARRNARQRFRAMSLGENADNSNGKSDEIPIRRDKKDEVRARKQKKKMADGTILMDPDENMIGNPDVGAHQAAESCITSFKVFKEKYYNRIGGSFRHADMKAKAGNDNEVKHTHDPNHPDHIKSFYKDNVVNKDGGSLTATAKYERYCHWMDKKNEKHDTDHEPLALPTFGREAGYHCEKQGISKAKIAGRVRYIGCGLKGE